MPKHLHNKPKKQLKHVNEVSAGGVVFKRVNGRILIGFILDPYKKWIFAKGHLEDIDKTIKAAAVRETKEEMGLKSLRVKAPLGQIKFSFTRKNLRIHKVVHYFLMEVRPSEKGTPQKEEKIKAIRWVSMPASRKLLGYENTMLILDRALDWLKKDKIRREEKESEQKKTLIEVANQFCYTTDHAKKTDN